MKLHPPGSDFPLGPPLPMRKILPAFRHWISVFAAILLATTAFPATSRLLILHTNDGHDHVRAGDSGTGGLPYVSGYVRSVRAEEPAVLLFDAGDVTEKGDLVAFRTHGVMTYEAMRRIGYDGVAVGNHDFDDLALAQIHGYEQALGQGLLCLNIVRPDGTPEFTGSRIVERGGVKIGVIGMIVPRKPEQGGLDFAASGRALAKEADRLKAEGAALVVAVCHETVKQCAQWSQAAPAVQVFVSGHSHEALAKPFVVPETGAIIVQAGSYSRWVGRLELEFDPATRKIVRHDGRLVAMDHSAIPVDAAMLAWVQERERALAPEAAEFVCDNPAVLDGFSVARIAANGLRRAAAADIGFCHPYQVIRDTLPAGRVDVNAVFKTGGHRGHENVIVELTGVEVAAYVNALVTVQREPPEWSGFRITRRKADGGGETWATDLEPTRRYQTVMPKIEWETRFLRLAAKVKERDAASPLATGKFSAQPVDADFTTATTAEIRRILSAGETLAAHAAALATAREF